MKWVAALLMFSSFAFAAEFDNVEVVKSADGKTVYCELATDANNSGYKPLIFTIIPDGDGLKLNLGLAALICHLQKDDSVVWGARKFNEPVPYRGFVDSTYITENQEFTLVNQRSDILKLVPLANDFMQVMEFTLPMNQILSPSQQQKLDAGQAIRLRWEFFLRGNAYIRTSKELIQLGMRTSGSYYLNFTVRKSGSLIEVKDLRMN